MKTKLNGLISLLLVFVLVAGCLSGCGEKAAEPAPTEAVKEEPAPTEEAAEDAADETAEKEDAAEPTEVQSDLIVKKIEDYEPGAIRGVDVSSFLSIMDAFDIENKEIKDDSQKKGFRDKDGKLLDRQGFFDLLAASGVNYIRTRVFNDPKDGAGHGYGGGNNTVARAKEIATYASKAGLGNLIDFHLSDFWADPSKQMVPKAWKKYGGDKKAKAIGSFLKKSLSTIEEDGAVVTMVQIGNEINTGFCGETSPTTINKLLDAGCDAVHEYGESEEHKTHVSDGNREGDAFFGAADPYIYAVIHLTEPQAEGTQVRFAAQLSAYNGNEGVSYDVFASSYYPYWHGTPENLTKVLSTIAETYDKYVMVAETSWAARLDDGDGHPNTVSAEKNSTDMPYRFTAQGQADEIRTVADAVNQVSVDIGDKKAGLGMFYWEPAWIPVGNVSALSGAGYKKALKKNKSLWEKTGSGWASSYAKEYDPKDAGKYFGGSAVDNQAWFDYDGNPLSTLDVYNYLTTGSTASVRPDGYQIDAVRIVEGNELTMPDTANIVYNDGSEESAAVTWDEKSVNKVKTDEEGIYFVRGSLADDPSYEIKATVIVAPPDYMEEHDGSFEADPTPWTIKGDGIKHEFEEAKNNAVTGKGYINFWGESEIDGSIESEAVTLDKPGKYKVTVTYHGEVEVGSDKGEDVRLIVETDSGKKKSRKFVANGWQNYLSAEVPGISITEKMIDQGKNEIKILIRVKLGGGRWMALDDVKIVRE